MMEPAATSAMDTTLPLRLRLRRALLIALLLGLWAPVKIDDVAKVEINSAMAHVITSFVNSSRIASTNCGSRTCCTTSAASWL